MDLQDEVDFSHLYLFNLQESEKMEPEIAVCKTDDDNDLSPEELQEKYQHLLDTYKKRLNFQSAWVVE